MKEKKSLVFEFPVASFSDPEPGLSDPHGHPSTRAHPILPQPDLVSVPRLLFNPEVPNEVIQVLSFVEMQKLADNLFEAAQDRSKDVLGSVSTLTNCFLTMSHDQLKLIKDKILNLSIKKEVVRSLFYDIISIVGTNPSLMLIKEDIENGDLNGRTAINILQAAFRSVKTPTEDLLKNLVNLIKILKNLQSGIKGHNLYRVGMVHMSKLLHRACIHPVRRVNEFPVRIFGHFCSKDSSVITEEWIPFLKGELSPIDTRNSTDDHNKLAALAALGHLGHLKGLLPLARVIEGEISDSPLVRSAAVYALKPMTILHPELLKPVIFSIINNPADNTEVRMAALSIMPWSQPSAAELLRVAALTWAEPSKQVNSFIYSTFQGLTKTQIPELRAVGYRASTTLHLIKPDHNGIVYSHNELLSNFVTYLKVSSASDIAWEFNSKFPSMVKISNKIYNSASTFDGFSFDIYSQGMDFLLENFFFSPDEGSQYVNDLLDKISKDLKIKEAKKTIPEMLLHTGFAGFENFHSLDREHLSKLLQESFTQLEQESML